MATWIAFFRGINVGGHHILPMRELVAGLADIGCTEVRTWVQSGNVVFRSKARSGPKLAERVSTLVGERHGFRPQVMVLTPDRLADAARRNPYPASTDEPKTLHLWFLDRAPEAPDLAGLTALRSHGEQFSLVGPVFYLHAPQGIGQSRLAGRVEALLGAPATARNWRTVSKVLELVDGLAAT